MLGMRIKRKLVLLGALTLIVLTTVVPVLGDELIDAQSQKDYIDKQINDLARQKQNEKNKLNSVQQEKSSIVNSQVKVEKDVQLASGDLKKIQDEIKALDNSIIESETKYKKQMELYKKRIRIMYQNSNDSYINAISNSENMSDFLSRLQILSAIAKRDQELAINLNQAKKDVEYKKNLKDDERAQREKTLDDKKKTMTSIQYSRALKEEEERRISNSLSSLERQENELLRTSEQLKNTILSLKLRRQGAYVNGQMFWPTPGYGTVTSLYGNRFHPVLRTYRMHTGIDIGAPSGAAIVAANKGTVILAGWQDGYGNTIIVDHGGDIVTLYAHCSRILAWTGQEVDAGEVIAKVGSTGLSTGPHLHFEVRTDGNTADPLQYVSP